MHTRQNISNFAGSTNIPGEKYFHIIAKQKFMFCTFLPRLFNLAGQFLYIIAYTTADAWRSICCGNTDMI